MGAESKLWAPAVGRLASAHRQLRTVWGVEGKPGGAPRSLLLRLNVTTPRGSKLARVCAVRMGGSAAQESIGDGWASCLLPLARADRQNQPLRIAYYSPCFEYRADLTFALSFLFFSVLSVHQLCSVFAPRTDLFLIPQSQLQSNTKQQPACPICCPHDGCSSPELLASHGRSEATGKIRISSPCLLCCSQPLPGYHLTCPSSSNIDSVCPPWRHR